MTAQQTSERYQSVAGNQIVMKHRIGMICIEENDVKIARLKIIDHHGFPLIGDDIMTILGVSQKIFDGVERHRWPDTFESVQIYDRQSVPGIHAMNDGGWGYRFCPGERRSSHE